MWCVFTMLSWLLMIATYGDQVNIDGTGHTCVGRDLVLIWSCFLRLRVIGDDGNSSSQSLGTGLITNTVIVNVLSFR